MKKLISFLTLFSSFSTLICCAIPATLVVLGFGAALAGILDIAPQIVLFSEYKNAIFIFAGVMLATSAYLQWRFQPSPEVCVVDGDDPSACETTRSWTKPVFWISVVMYAIGVFVVFILPHFLGGS